MLKMYTIGYMAWSISPLLVIICRIPLHPNWDLIVLLSGHITVDLPVPSSSEKAKGKGFP